MFDQVVRLQRNTIGGPAPPVLLSTYVEGGPSAETTPLDVVEKAMADARRMQVRVILIDIDLAPPGQTRAAAEVKGFHGFLEDWASDRTAPLAIFLRGLSSQEDAQNAPPLLGPTPLDDVVSAAPNLAWASSRVTATDDGIVRYQDYYSCVTRPGGSTAAIAGAPLLAATAIWDARTGAAKRALRAALNDPELCAPRVYRKSARGPISLSGLGMRVSLPGSVVRFRHQRGLIDFHLDDPAHAGRSPSVAAGPWAAGAPALTTWAPSEMHDLGPDFGRGAIMILGSSQPLFPDRHWTPYHTMTGDLVLANGARGLALVGPIDDVPTTLQALELLLAWFAIYEFFGVLALAHKAAQTSANRWWLIVARGATSRPMARIWALVVIYMLSLTTGYVLLGFGYWQLTPMVAASVGVLIFDVEEIVEGRKPKLEGAGHHAS